MSTTIDSGKMDAPIKDTSIIDTKPTARFQAVLFDLDGTLLDTAPDFLTATNRLLAERNMPLIAENNVRSLVTHGSVGIIQTVFNMDEQHSDFEITRQQLLSFYEDHIADKTKPFNGIDELLLRLGNENIPWGIVTNKPEFYTQSILERLPLSSCPKTIICPDHVSQVKPHPEPVLLACKELDIAPESTVYIGDHLRDIQAGLSAGTTTIAASYGYIDNDEDVASWGAHHIVDCATQLQEFIFTS